MNKKSKKSHDELGIRTNQDYLNFIRKNHQLM
jgi:hypothetical protein